MFAVEMRRSLGLTNLVAAESGKRNVEVDAMPIVGELWRDSGGDASPPARRKYS